MRLAHLQQQIAQLRESKELGWENESFHQHIVMLHLHISGAATAFKNRQPDACGSELASLLIRLVNFPTHFPDWDDIWGSQRLEDFKLEQADGKDLWHCFYKLHQLASALVGGRSDIILLYKMVQLARAAAEAQKIDLTRAVKNQMDKFWQGQLVVN